jgi:4-amino-4-deoxy-L-arabinose transferase-like glycosyltransferase
MERNRESQGCESALFYIVEKLFSTLPGNEHLVYRLASILGFACMLACIFTFIKRRFGGPLALLCSSTLLLMPFLRPYAVEARPYSLVAASLAFALVCYQQAPSIGWMILMAAALTTAETLHYYSIFAFVPFAAAELAVSLRIQRLRRSVWISLAAGFVPLVAFWPLLNGLRHFYGTHLWDPPTLFATANTYSLLFRTSVPFALGLVACLAAAAFFLSDPPPSVNAENASIDAVRDRWLVIAFLTLPILVFAITKLMHGAYTERYVLPALFGLPLSLAYSLRRLNGKTIALAAVLILVAIASQEIFFWQSAIHDTRHFTSPAKPIEGLVARAGFATLPVVVSDGEDYLQLVYYSRDSKRFLSLSDPPRAIAYIHTDSVDLQLPLLRCCAPVQIYSFQEFGAQHKRFLLYSGGGAFDWWPARLLDDGDSLQLLAEDQNRRVYLVNLKANAGP